MRWTTGKDHEGHYTYSADDGGDAEWIITRLADGTAHLFVRDLLLGREGERSFGDPGAAMLFVHNAPHPSCVNFVRG